VHHYAIDFGAKLRADIAARRTTVQPPAQPEPEARPIDYGAGARAMAPASERDGFRRWVAAQYHRSRLQSVTVTTNREKP
jgi:hypothetical protein